jgi:hypothetical protein
VSPGTTEVKATGVKKSGQGGNPLSARFSEGQDHDRSRLPSLSVHRVKHRAAVRRPLHEVTQFPLNDKRLELIDEFESVRDLLTVPIGAALNTERDAGGEEQRELRRVTETVILTGVRRVLRHLFLQNRTDRLPLTSQLVRLLKVHGSPNPADGKTMIQSRTGGFQLFVNINRMIFACAKREESFCRVWVKKFIDADFLAHGNPSFLSFERDVNVLS